jgi:hypothetical protein
MVAPKSPAAIAADLLEETTSALDRRVAREPSRLVSDLISAWATVVQRMYSVALDLWKIPFESGAGEDSTLGANRTSVNFPKTTGTPQLRCTEACLLQPLAAGAAAGVAGAAGSGPTAPLDVSAGVALSVPKAVDGTAVLLVEITMPRTAPAGLYRLTIKNDAGSETATYLHPFGVPGVSR